MLAWSEVKSSWDWVSRQHLRSARCHYLVVPRYSGHNLSSYGCRAFDVAGPTAWNSLSGTSHWQFQTSA